MCVLVLLLPVVQDVNLRITHDVVHLRDNKGIVYPSQNVSVSIFTYPHLVLNFYAVPHGTLKLIFLKNFHTTEFFSIVNSSY